jgi:hypothetical protein
MKSYSYYASILVVFTIARALGASSGSNDWGAVTNGAQMSISLKEGEKDIKTHQPDGRHIHEGAQSPEARPQNALFAPRDAKTKNIQDGAAQAL